MGFIKKRGHLYCEGIPVQQVLDLVGSTPFYIYSAQKIEENYAGYQDALKKFAGVVSYAVKANGNIHILKRLRQLGSWATLVSGNELLLALAAGFEPNELIFNGNGKTLPELRLAIDHGVLINLDSDYDLEHIGELSIEMGIPVQILLRINPDIDPGVHPYISTGLRESKFGLRPDKIPGILKRIGEFPKLQLVGLHCHLGSTITDLDVFRQTMVLMARYYEEIWAGGYPLKYLNLGGGLGIDYSRERGDFPTPDQLVGLIADQIPEGARLILEPGRSIIGDAGGLVCRVIGVKKTESKNFIVIDGSMAEFIRPSLYQADHKIGFLQPIAGPSIPFDIVGPVCESADILGLDRVLPTPPEGTGVFIYDTGAYGYAMSSNYNARLRPAEYWIDNGQVVQIRRGETIEDLLRPF